MQHCTKQAIAIRLECYQICVTLVALTGSDVKRSWLFFADFHFCCLLCRVQFRWKAILSGHLLNLGCPFQKAAVKCSLLTSFSLYPLLPTPFFSSPGLLFCYLHPPPPLSFSFLGFISPVPPSFIFFCFPSNCCLSTPFHLSPAA